jgi:hypothetical protein
MLMSQPYCHCRINADLVQRLQVRNSIEIFSLIWNYRYCASSVQPPVDATVDRPCVYPASYHSDEPRKGFNLMTVWAYVDTSKNVGDRDHLKLFAGEDAAREWFEAYDPEGVAFEYPVIQGYAGG